MGKPMTPRPRNATLAMSATLSLIWARAGRMGGRRVSPLLVSRLERGRSVYESLNESLDGQSAPMLIVSGGKGSDERLSEAEAMANYLVEAGFPVDRILKEDQSSTTEENLLFSAALMKEMRPEGYRCVVVTNDFHSYRAALIARDLGVPAQVVGSPTAAYFLPSATIREFIAVFVRYWKVNLPICAFLAAPALVMLAR